MRKRWVQSRWMERWSGRKTGSAITKLCTFRHHRDSILTVRGDCLVSIQLSINKCRFHSGPACDTLIVREINISAEKSILLPLPSQLIALSVVLALLGKAAKCGTYLRVRWLAAIQALHNKWSNAQRQGPTHLKNMALANVISSSPILTTLTHTGTAEFICCFFFFLLGQCGIKPVNSTL